MASCQITITGTTGSVQIRYYLGDIFNTITAKPGDPVYVDSTVTLVTYTRLSGDAAATSGCLSITNLIQSCYIFMWETPKPTCDTGNVFDAIILGSTTYVIDEVSITNSYFSLAESLSTLGQESIIPYSGKAERLDTRMKNYLVVQTLGTDIPYLRIKNTTTTFNMYLKGVTSVCSPNGYTAIDVCQPVDEA
jgi:hypothetical protein